LDDDVFKALNGEVAWPFAATDDVLRRLDLQGVQEIAWELWLVDHQFDIDALKPVFSRGRWLGMIPLIDGSSVVIGGSGSPSDCASQIRLITYDAGLLTATKRWLRVNFTIL
jgi:hypothetical protein